MWNQERTLALIDDLGNNACLWDPYHKDFKHRKEKVKAYENLAKKYCTRSENIEKKIQALKNQFRREQRKVNGMAYKGSASSSKQALWFGYEGLSFLIPAYQGKIEGRRLSQNDTNERSSDETAPTSPVSCKEENLSIESAMGYAPYVTENPPSPQNDYNDTNGNWSPEADVKAGILTDPAMQDFDDMHEEKYKIQPGIQQNETPVKRYNSEENETTSKRYLPEQSEHQQNETTSKRCHPGQPEHKKNETTSKRYYSDQNEYQQIARVWANELQKMDRTQQAFAKKAINEILFEGQMGTLRRNSLIINNPPVVSNQSSNGDVNGTQT